MNLLLEILSMKRPHGGLNEGNMLVLLSERLHHQVHYIREKKGVKVGNVMAAYITTDDDSRTLFTSHLDTCHYDELVPNPVMYDAELGLMYKKDGTCLGADDGAGVCLMMKMIMANVPGTYLFTVGEERGGVGANYMADHEPEFLLQFDRAIAFDRAGTSDVITHQGYGRCCSDEFAQALSNELNFCALTQDDLTFRPDNTGVYTDTAEFVGLIPECTNLSIGYANQHGGGETQDVFFLLKMLEACKKVAWDLLPTKRKVTDVDEPNQGFWDGYGAAEETTLDMLLAMEPEEIGDFCWDYPERMAELIVQAKEGMGYDAMESEELNHV